MLSQIGFSSFSKHEVRARFLLSPVEDPEGVHPSRCPHTQGSMYVASITYKTNYVKCNKPCLDIRGRSNPFYMGKSEGRLHGGGDIDWVL